MYFNIDDMKKGMLIFVMLLFSASFVSSLDIDFLHHSTGRNVYEAGVSDWFDAYNLEHGTDYNFLEEWYPFTRDNYPVNYWKLWISENHLEIYGEDYDVIIWKHCYPGSDVLEDIGSASADSSRKSIENYKLQYADLREKLSEYPDTLFILWTLPPRHRNHNPSFGSASSNAQRATDFTEWVKNDWLDEGSGNYENLYIFDFRGHMINPSDNFLKYEYELSHSGDDSHPNSVANNYVVPIFSQFVVDSIESFSWGICQDDSDCPNDIIGSWSSNYCENGDVYQSRINVDYSCVIPDCISEEINEKVLVEDCLEGCLDGSCIVSQNCDLTSASWSEIEVEEGTEVSLNVQGNNCDGQEVSFEIWEDDFILNDPVIITPFNVYFSGSNASSTWIVEWQEDGLNGMSGNPEYMFRASLVEDNAYVISNNLLEVSPLCSNSIIQTGEDCDDGSQNGVSCNAPYMGSCEYCNLNCEVVSLTGSYCEDGTCDSEEDFVSCPEDCEEPGEGPHIDSVSEDNLVDGDLIIITGQNFGNSPDFLLFDDFENGVDGDPMVTNLAQVGQWDELNLDSNSIYSSINPLSGDLSFRADQSCTGKDCVATDYLGKRFSGIGSNQVFASWWIYLPLGDNYPGEGTTYSTNWKQTWIQGSGTADDDLIIPTFGDADPYARWGGNDNCIPNGVGTIYFGGWNFQKGEWYRLSAFVDGDNVNGELYLSDVTSNGIEILDHQENIQVLCDSDSIFERIRINGYGRNTPNSHPMFDDVYISQGPNAKARIEIGNSQDYWSSTKLSVATPMDWNVNSITANVWEGSFGDEQLYLFVIDSEGEVSNGAPISFGSTSQTPFCEDGICNGVENCNSCEQDCEVCQECVNDQLITGWCDCNGTNYQIGYCCEGVYQVEFCGQTQTEVIIDNDDINTDSNGNWLSSTHYPLYYGDNYLYSTPESQEGLWFEWSTDNLYPGLYNVLVSWTNSPGRPYDVSYEITHADGVDLVENVDHRVSETLWNQIGQYNFSNEGSVRVISGSTGPSEGTCADAVKFFKVDNSGCTSDSQCTDYDICTDDVCSNGVCQNNNNVAPCDDSDLCTENDVCSNGICEGTLKDCSGNDFDEIASCNGVPDGLNFTWDYLAEFDSVCQTGVCTIGDSTLEHSCNIEICGAECESDIGCQDTNPLTEDFCNSSCECEHISQEIISQTIIIKSGWNVISVNISTNLPSSELEPHLVLSYGERGWERVSEVLEPLKAYYVYSVSSEDIIYPFEGISLGSEYKYGLIDMGWNLFSVSIPGTFNGLYPEFDETFGLYEINIVEGDFSFNRLNVTNDILQPGHYYWIDTGSELGSPLGYQSGIVGIILEVIRYFKNII